MFILPFCPKRIFSKEGEIGVTPKPILLNRYPNTLILPSTSLRKITVASQKDGGCGVTPHPAFLKRYK
jgi:hypothetical protein